MARGVHTPTTTDPADRIAAAIRDAADRQAAATLAAALIVSSEGRWLTKLAPMGGLDEHAGAIRLYHLVLGANSTE